MIYVAAVAGGLIPGLNVFLMYKPTLKEKAALAGLCAVNIAVIVGLVYSVG